MFATRYYHVLTVRFDRSNDNNNDKNNDNNRDKNNDKNNNKNNNKNTYHSIDKIIHILQFSS